MAPTAAPRFNVTLVQPKGYVHALGLWDVGRLVRSALRSLELPTNLSVNHIAAHATNILLGGHLVGNPESIQGIRYVVYQLEQLSDALPHGYETVLRNAVEVWDFSAKNVARLGDLGIAVQHVPLGFHEDLFTIKDRRPQIDVLHYGSMNERRQRLLEALSRECRVQHAFGVYGAERDALVARSKVVLNAHFYDQAICEQPRLSYLLNNRRAIVTEESVDSPFASATAVPYEELVGACLRLVRDDDQRLALAERDHECFRRQPMSAILERLPIVQEAVKQTEGVAESNVADGLNSGDRSPCEARPLTGQVRLGAAIPVLNEWRFLPAVVGQLLKIVDRCIILRGRRSFSGAAAKLAAMPVLDPRVEVIEGEWGSEHETRNHGIEVLSDCDYILTVDSDEIFTDPDLKRLRDLCTSSESPAIAARLWTYWKSPDYRIEPPEPLAACVAVRPNVRFTKLRQVDCTPYVADDLYCRHLSYVRTDEELREKLRLFGHHAEILPNWYDEVWKRWNEDPTLENLHPTHPAAYHRAVFDPDRELNQVLADHGCEYPDWVDRQLMEPEGAPSATVVPAPSAVLPTISIARHAKVSILAAIPAYGGVEGTCVTSIVQLQAEAAKRGIIVGLSIVNGCSYVPHARTQLLSALLEGDWTHVLMLDSDVEFRAGTVLEMLDKNRDFVVAPVPIREVQWEWIELARERGLEPLKDFGCRFNIQFASEQIVVEDDLIRVCYAGVAFALIKRSAIQRMVDHYTDVAYELGKNTFHGLFHPLIVDRRMLPEDYAFCWRWTNLGGEIWLYPNAPVCHTGPARFAGNLASLLKLDQISAAKSQVG